MTERPGIYLIRCGVSSKQYVGSASNISKRWSRHRADLRLNQHPNLHLQASWNKHGEVAFAFSVLELTSDLTAREQHWLDTLSPEFNVCRVARSSRGTVRGPHSEQAKARISAALKGRCGYGITSPPLHGEANPSAKLTAGMIADMRAEYGAIMPQGKGRPHSRPSYKEIGIRYGVSVATAWAAINGRSYRRAAGVKARQREEGSGT